MQTATTETIRAEFNRIADDARAAGNPDAAAKAELLREWFTNPKFRRELADYTFALTSR